MRILEVEVVIKMTLHDWKTSGGRNEDRVEGRSLEKANSSETYLQAIKVN